MSASRLNFALDNGAVALPPEGRIAVFRPRADLDLGGLGRERLHVLQSCRPDHDAFAAAGYATGLEPEGDYAAALVCLTRARAEARAFENPPPAVDMARWMFSLRLFFLCWL